MRRIAGIALVVAVGCTPDPIVDDVTAVRITVTFDTAGVDQLTYRVWSGDVLRFMGRRPEEPGPIKSPTSFVLVVDDELGGETMDIQVDGESGGEVIASGRATFTLVATTLVEASITLGAPSICGDGRVRDGVETCDDANLVGGDGCNSGCRIESGFTCRHTASTRSVCERSECDPICVAGQRCEASQCVCDATSCPTGCCIASACLEADEAACGPGADRCFAGACACGSEPSCAPGQACSGGQCVCTAESCAGCCRGSTCTVRSLADCGVTGATCTTCSSTTADTCSGEGRCGCLGGPACELGQRCGLAGCLCDGESCPDGCCRNGVCERAMSATQCGRNGEMCASCEPAGDSCSPDGTCRCGSGPACATGQTCAAGSCVCDSTACSGCCDNDTCVTGAADNACGSGGDLCTDCGAAGPCMGGTCSGCAQSCLDGCCSGNTCSRPSIATCGRMGQACVACHPMLADTCDAAGACACGGGAACGDGQRCVDRTCRCDGTSCPNGCCDGDQCNARTLATCGVGGVACTACDSTTASTCNSAGQCACDTGPPCADGLACIGGACQCGGTSCPNGCCDNGVCAVSDLTTCGTGGAVCTACDPTTTDRCTQGACRCGPGLACAAGSRCMDGACICDASSCPTGCCRNGTCDAGNRDNRCGTGGVACANCNSMGQSCTNQQCQ